jgi:hypothetical protein
MEISSKIYRTPQYKSAKIRKWKKRGVVCEDFDMLYQEYIKKTKCEHCDKDFKSTRNRHLDHDHSTGLFRAVVCQACNTKDTYIKYPNGYDNKEYREQYRKENREKIKEYAEQYREENRERKKQYYKDNKEKISELKKQHYQDNKEYINERNKQYLKQNKEKISEQRKQTVICECGEIITKIHMLRHTRTFKHMNPFCDYPKTNIFT